MNLIETINLRKEELAEVINRKAYLENEIADLEYQVTKVKLNNPDACLEVTQLIDKGGCVGCNFENGCSFLGKYKKFKL